MEATHVQFNRESVYCYLLRSVVYYIRRLYVVLHIVFMLCAKHKGQRLMI